MTPARTARAAASALLITLILLCLAWELWLAPIRPGGSWLVLKALPLLVPLFGVLHGKRYTFQWTTLLIWLYVAEGTTRAWSDNGPSAQLAFLEAILAFGYFAAAVAYVRSTRSGITRM